MDNFTIAVLAGGGVVVAVFILMLMFDKKEPGAGRSPSADRTVRKTRR